MTASKCISTIVQSWSRSASLCALDPGLNVYLQTHSITAYIWISILARSRPRSVHLSSLDHGVVKHWSENAGSPSSTLHHTSHGIRREFLTKRGSGPRNVGKGWADLKGYLAMMNHTNSVDLWKLGNSVWDQELGKIDCVFHIMRWCLSTRRSPKYILPVPESISGIPLSLYVYI